MRTCLILGPLASALALMACGDGGSSNAEVELAPLVRVPEPLDSQARAQTIKRPSLVEYESVSDAFRAGKALRDRGQFAAAQEAFVQAVEFSPDSAAFHYQLGAVLQARARYRSAKAEFERALELDGDYHRARVALAKVRYDVSGDVETAVELLDEAVAAAADEVRTEARYTLGLIYQREGDFASAVEQLRAVIDADPGYRGARTQLGLCHFRAGDYDAATQVLERSVREDAYDAVAFLTLGQVKMRRGDTELGQRLLARAEQLRVEDDQLQPHLDMLRQHPEQPQAHYNVGASLNRFGRYAQAGRHYLHAIELDSAYALAYQGMGSVSMRSARKEVATRYYLQALTLDPSLAECHNNLGLIHYADRELDRAVDSYLKAVSLDPERAHFHANLATAYRDLRRVEEAEAAVLKALELNDRLLGARELLGDVIALRGNLEEAIAIWRDIAAASPQDQKLRTKIRRALELLESESTPPLPAQADQNRG